VAAHTALSLKQPWATLLAHGLKTIEVRSWATRLRGPLLIHAARIPDDRPEAWKHVPAALREAAETMRGGVVGAGELLGCRTYRSAEAFQRDQAFHLNEPGWFRPPALYGLEMGSLRPLPFYPCPGQTRFFWVDMPGDAPADRVGLLVSVRSAEEGRAALAGGADLFDVKEPSRGSLGRAEGSILAETVAAVRGCRPLSAALGEQAEASADQLPAGLWGLDYVKWGLAGCKKTAADWRVEWRRLAARVREASPTCQPVLVAYADWERAGAPDYEEVSRFALERPGGVLLLDTCHKDGSTLFDHMSQGSLRALMERCRLARVSVALAGSLGLEHLDLVRQLGPAWLAVRGAACTGGRTGTIDAARVRALAERLAAPVSTPGKRSRHGS
jgi:uncharacterized protein (UPF0264 family)